MEQIAQLLSPDHDVAGNGRGRVGRPSLSGNGSSPRMSFRTSSVLYSAAQQRAEEKGISISELAREALERYLKP